MLVDVHKFYERQQGGTNCRKAIPRNQRIIQVKGCEDPPKVRWFELDEFLESDAAKATTKLISLGQIT